jgi:hypothetical protein
MEDLYLKLSALRTNIFPLVVVAVAAAKERGKTTLDFTVDTTDCTYFLVVLF